MNVFLTGASGFIGSALLPQLLDHGHRVLALARSEQSASALTAQGAQVERGSLTDLPVLHAAAKRSDAVIHCAFIHDFNNYQDAADIDRAAIHEMGTALEGTERPLIVTSGSLVVDGGGSLALETDLPNPKFPRVSEDAALAFHDRGLRPMIVRLPPSVHGEGDHGFVPYLIHLAREKGFSAYIGNGENRWPAVHRLDAARLYRLALERGTAGTRYHAIADEGIPFRQIAELIGARLNLPVRSIAPEKAPEHFGWMGLFVGTDGPASSAWTRKQLGWEPQQPGLLADVDSTHYFPAHQAA